MNPVEPQLPFRPRLADHASLRRHFVDGREVLILHDVLSDEVREIDGRTLEILLCADGTRDLGGVMLAAVRGGVYRKASEVYDLMVDLQRRGLLVDGIEAGPPHHRSAVGHPVEVLEGYRLRCDASGACCTGYSSVLFSWEEALRARTLVPEVLNRGEDQRRGLLPVQSSVAGRFMAMTMVDGRCPYLAPDGRCRLQLLGGSEAKPVGCRIFPATFVDDGAAVRVSVSVECPCVLASLGVDDGATLVPAGVRTEGELAVGSAIVRLPRELELCGGVYGTRGELRSWSEAILAWPGQVTDPLAVFWTLAGALGERGRLASDVAGTLERAAAPAPQELGFPLMQLSSRLLAKQRVLRSWRSESDRARRLVDWLVESAEALQELSVVEALLAPLEPLRLEQERFYLRATLFGHHLALSGQSLEQGLRDRALRLLLARAMARQISSGCMEDPAAPYPLAAVEAMMRGQGLEASGVAAK